MPGGNRSSYPSRNAVSWVPFNPPTIFEIGHQGGRPWPAATNDGRGFLSAFPIPGSRCWRRTRDLAAANPKEAASDYGFHIGGDVRWSKQVFDEMEIVVKTYGIKHLQSISIGLQEGAFDGQQTTSSTTRFAPAAAHLGAMPLVHCRERRCRRA